MELTDEQRECIEEIYGSAAAIKAGAGSGKTATLTRRMVYALEHPEKSGVTDIGQILAITFTNKAANELKSRIKAALQQSAAAGNENSAEMARHALGVEDAWISTIHGMCSRILKENAFELGIDPAFELATQDKADLLLAQAIENALLEKSENIDEQLFQKMLDEYEHENIKEIVTSLIQAAKKVGKPVRKACVYCKLESSSYRELLDEFLHVHNQIFEYSLQFKASATLETWLLNSQKAQEDTKGFLRKIEGRRDLTYSELCSIVSSFPAPDGRLKPHKDISEYVQINDNVYTPKAAVSLCALRITLAAGLPCLPAFIELAERSLQHADALKRQLGVLDTDDLITLTAILLKNNPQVRKHYANKFKLIMVDEFQDTDICQLAIISSLSGQDYPSSKVMVVGDAEQSIYRFRGADLAVFNTYVSQVKQASDNVIELSDNFRSHSTILAFAGKTFENDADCLQLNHGRSEDLVQNSGNAYKGSAARIQVIAASGASVAEKVRLESAQEIAKRFKQLIKEGHKPSDMVILLGVMTNASVYEQALKDAGLPCAVTGGSVLKEMTETKVMVNLCLALVNLKDTQALLNVLVSDLFGLNAEELLQLMPYSKDGKNRSCSLSDEFIKALKFEQENAAENADEDVEHAGASVDVSAEGSAGAGADTGAGTGIGAGFGTGALSPRVKAAIKVLVNAAKRVGAQPLSSIMYDVLAQSGWLLRSHGQGHFQVANALKVIRMVEALELEDGSDALTLARRLALQIESISESPGVLSAQNDEFIRIMTIHASKGLEFPIVAVSEINNPRAQKEKIRQYSFGQKTYVSLMPDKSSHLQKDGIFGGTGRRALEKLGLEVDVDVFKQQKDSAIFHYAVLQKDYEEEMAEIDRKIYVAYTRAREALIICTGKLPSKNSDSDPLPQVNKLGWIFELVGKQDVDNKEIVLPQSFTFPNGERVSYDISFKMLHVPKEDTPVIEKREDVIKQIQEASQAKNGQLEEALEENEQASEQNAQESQEDNFIVFQNIPEQVHKDYRYSQYVSNGVLSASRLMGLDENHEVQHKKDESADKATSRALADEEQEELISTDSSSLSLSGASATDKGTAFHMLAEWSAKHLPVKKEGEQRKFSLAPKNVIQKIAEHFMLSENDIKNLEEKQLPLWLNSNLAVQVGCYKHIKPEVPFFVQLSSDNDSASSANSDVNSLKNEQTQDGKTQGCVQKPLHIEGFIDLLAYDELGKGEAFIVDYKTGSSLLPSERREHYKIQAYTYAYAALLQGFSSVRLIFVYVDSQPDENGQPFCVEYPNPDGTDIEFNIETLGAKLRELL